MRSRWLIGCLLIGACSENTDTVNEGGGGAAGVPSCGLPAAGAPGVAKPAGAPGNLTILDWAGFKGAVTYSFDDANSSQINHFDELSALLVPMTFYIQTGKSSAKDPVWKRALDEGHELGNHTKSHLETGDAETLGADIDAASAFLHENFGVTAVTFAAPYGANAYTAPAETRFLLNRGVNNAVIAPKGTNNPFNLPCFVPEEGAPAADLNASIDAARTAGGWRVVLVHGFTGGTDGAYHPIDIAEFVSHVGYAKSLGDLWLDSMVHVGAYWRAQKAVSESTPTVSGDQTTWQWTLPEHFPPGLCLRATVDGGTLTQNGKALAWDDHGYYSIALDAGSVTLSP